MTATHDAETENDSAMVADPPFMQGLEAHDVSMTGQPTFWKPVIVLGRQYHTTAPRRCIYANLAETLALLIDHWSELRRRVFVMKD